MHGALLHVVKRKFPFAFLQSLLFPTLGLSRDRKNYRLISFVPDCKLLELTLQTSHRTLIECIICVHLRLMWLDYSRTQHCQRHRGSH